MLSIQRAALRAGLIFAILLRVKSALALSPDDANSIKVKPAGIQASSTSLTSPGTHATCERRRCGNPVRMPYDVHSALDLRRKSHSSWWQVMNWHLHWEAQHLSCRLSVRKRDTFRIDKCISYISDPGKYSGTPESSFYVGAVQNKNEVPANITSCSDLLTGSILNQPVVVATSGKDAL